MTPEHRRLFTTRLSVDTVRKAARRVGIVCMAAALNAPMASLAEDPMKLETQGIFWAGGEVVNRTQPGLESRKILRGQAYVEYFVPKNVGKNPMPIVLTHSSISGVIWRSTPDGREGWAEFFVRHGYPVFVIDPPGIGRAGFDVDDINLAARGLSPPFTNNPLGHGDSNNWPSWNLGPQFGVPGDGILQGNQMPNDEESLRHFLAAMMPSRGGGGLTGNQPSFIAVLERVKEMFGPAIFVGWSSAGGLGQRLVVERPDLFKALILLEGYNGQGRLPTPGNWFDYCPLDPPDAIVDTLTTHRLPFLSIDGQAGHSLNTGNAKGVCQTLVDMVNEEGGNATNIWLPDVGIVGNSHMMFWESNSDDSAQVVLDWIRDNVPKKPRP